MSEGCDSGLRYWRYKIDRGGRIGRRRIMLFERGDGAGRINASVQRNYPLVGVLAGRGN